MSAFQTSTSPAPRSAAARATPPAVPRSSGSSRQRDPGVGAEELDAAASAPWWALTTTRLEPGCGERLEHVRKRGAIAHGDERLR